MMAHAGRPVSAPQETAYRHFLAHRLARRFPPPFQPSEGGGRGGSATVPPLEGPLPEWPATGLGLGAGTGHAGGTPSGVAGAWLQAGSGMGRGTPVGGGGGGSGRPGTCFRCQEPGHWANACPRKGGR
jgi:hypothetical protein